MMVKWIVCEVPEKNRQAFSRGQEVWSELQGVEGFVAQFGGWNRERRQEACLVAVWRDELAYRQFMAEVHDPIYERTGQQGTFDSIRVKVFSQEMEVKPVRVELLQAKVIRVLEGEKGIVVEFGEEAEWLRNPTESECEVKGVRQGMETQGNVRVVELERGWLVLPDAL
jgi:hypothetical protein